MEIPTRCFFSPLRHEGRGPDAVDFSLLSLLPNFEPMTAANVAEFNMGWHHQILISISYEGYRLTSTQLVQILNHYSDHAQIQNGSYGHKLFIKPGFDEFFRGALENPSDFVSCKPATGPVSVPFPSCERTVLIGQDIIAGYSFSRAYLDQTQSIDTKVIGFLNGLRTAGPQFRIIQ